MAVEKNQPSQHAFQAPTGTRDFYPAELNRLRYIQDAWRRTAINHGFEEIDGPTFEHLELYTAKSGEGIVSELFSFERFGGEKTFALRPEFTPTLARMYASKAASLPKPTKWFWQQNCYRAERPQRGRLREFCQWNCDIIGGESTEDQLAADAESIACCVGVLQQLELTPEHVSVRIGHREVVTQMLDACNVPQRYFQDAINLLDRKAKIRQEDFDRECRAIQLDYAKFQEVSASVHWLAGQYLGTKEEREPEVFIQETGKSVSFHAEKADYLAERLKDLGIAEWCQFDFSIVRGLAYYTGMVFEVHEASGAERAIAGGGRYDKLIETFGGPPTPAVGFGMGDVVLSLVLQDKGLMPTDDQVAEKLGLRPDALVISNGTPEADAQVAPALAALRRAGLHARRSYKTTKNVGKLIQDAAKARARYCVILESATTAQLKNMDTQQQEPVAVADLAARIAKRA